MIDYDKLKEAHELNKKNTDYIIRINLYPHTDLCFYALYDLNSSEQIDCKNVDELIIKLKELTKPEPKYKLGDILFWSESNSIYLGEVINIDSSCATTCYFLDTGLVDCSQVYECYLYPTSEALIDAQINYWTHLKNEELSTRSDDMSMTPPFEGEIKGFNVATDTDGDTKCENESATLTDEDTKCEHESDGKLFYKMPIRENHYAWLEAPFNCPTRWTFMNKEWHMKPLDCHFQCKKCEEYYR